MKKIACILCLLLLVLPFVGCSSGGLRTAQIVTASVPPLIAAAKPLIKEADPENAVENLAVMDALSEAAEAAAPILGRLADKMEKAAAAEVKVEPKPGGSD